MIRVGAKNAKDTHVWSLLNLTLRLSNIEKVKLVSLTHQGPFFPSTLSVPVHSFSQALILCIMITLNPQCYQKDPSKIQLCPVIFLTKLSRQACWDFLVVQWLRLPICTAGDTDSIPGQGTKIPHAAQCGHKT